MRYDKLLEEYYIKKHDTRKALLQRMEALCKLVKVYNETRDKIDLESIKP